MFDKYGNQWKPIAARMKGKTYYRSGKFVAYFGNLSVVKQHVQYMISNLEGEICMNLWCGP